MRLSKEHDDATERVGEFVREGNAALNSSPRSGDGSAKGNTSDGSGINGRRRKKQIGYVQEEDSDSDDGEQQARIMRSRGPVMLTEAFAVPLLRSRVVAAVTAAEAAAEEQGTTNAGGSSAKTGARDATSSRKAKGWKGKGKQPALRKGKNCSAGEEEEEEEGPDGGVSDAHLREVFQYWAKKREGYGGPMLRCFHPFMMRLWKRMADPAREVHFVLHTVYPSPSRCFFVEPQFFFLYDNNFFTEYFIGVPRLIVPYTVFLMVHCV